MCTVFFRDVRSLRARGSDLVETRRRSVLLTERRGFLLNNTTGQSTSHHRSIETQRRGNLRLAESALGEMQRVPSGWAGRSAA